ncbi:hypothetical protein M0811_04730 [Anaeramoeba ignava]|uniref:Uncharacterized protein n=1 Tax=Anaeramoeba ignava TaxID=1746090 RepID=A0A9Q0LU06_ANAIG|nr:hypothetical protein M0811_04730 [Anaeramoeba ignava]
MKITIDQFKQFIKTLKEEKDTWFNIILYSISFFYQEKLTKNIESKENENLSIDQILKLSNIKNLKQNWQQNKLSEITNLKQNIEKTLKVNIQMLDLINDLFPNQDEKDQTIIKWIKEELKEKTIDNLKKEIQKINIANDDDLNQTKKYLINFIDIFNPFFTKTFQRF